MVAIMQYDAASLESELDQFVKLLINVVDDGASIGFMPPLASETAREYWQSRLAALASNDLILLVAKDAEKICGCVQLALEPRFNGSHRAEVQKLMVHVAHRRQGIGRALMYELEQLARSVQRSLLVLDTRQGDPSEILYQSMDYIHAGVIPQYARSANGDLNATVFYYKLIDPAS